MKRTDKVINCGQLLERHSQSYTLYDADGICPTIASGQKRYGGLPTWVKIEIDNNEEIEIQAL